MAIVGGDIAAILTLGMLHNSSGSVVSPPTTPTITGTATELDTEILAEVVEVLDEVGKEMIYYDYPNRAYDPTTGETTDNTEWAYNKQSIPPYNPDVRYVDGDLMKADDYLSGIAAKDIEFTPKRGMKVKMDGEYYKIELLKPIHSGQRIALYIFSMRK